MHWADAKISTKYLQLNFCWRCLEADQAQRSTWHRLSALKKRSKEQWNTMTSCGTFRKFLKWGILVRPSMFSSEPVPSSTPDCGKEKSHKDAIRALALIIWGKECCVTAMVEAAFGPRKKAPQTLRNWGTEQQEYGHKNMLDSEQHRKVKNGCTMIVSQIVLCVDDDSGQGLSEIL